MDERRLETAPTWLISLAACALTLSWAVTREWSAPIERVATAPPARTHGPNRWPIAQFPPLATPELSLAEPPVAYSTLLPSGVELKLATPRFTTTEPGGFNLPSVDRLVLAPLAAQPGSPTPSLSRRAGRTSEGFANRLLVLVPGEPRWRAGDAAPRVVSSKLRRDWAIATVDTLTLAHRAGRWYVAEDRVATVRDWAQGAFATATNRPRQIAAVAARAPTATTAPARAPSIVDYVARASQCGAFPTSIALAEQLDRVAQDAELAPWAWAVAYRLRTLAATPADDLAAHRALAALSDAATEAFDSASEIGATPAATELRRAAYGLTRRLATWRAEQTQTLAAMQRPATAADRLDGARWAMSAQGLGLAPGVLLREPGDDATRPTLRVAQRVEQYERRPNSRLAQILADDAARLASTGDAEAAALAAAIEQNYRNANVRVAIADALVQRMLPQPEPLVAPVRDRIAGAPVTGRSTTETQLDVRLTPDDSSWRIGLEARGTVMSQTYSRGGPAVLGARGATEFTASKMVVVNRDGLLSRPATAEAQTRSQRLVSLSTDYDRVPLLGSYVRSAAKQEYQKARPRALRETRLKVERQVSRTLDDRVQPRLAEIEERFAQNVTARAAALGLRVDPIEMRTTDKRLITRVRVAGESQLAAHTPRMRAPSDSLLSIQLHESTLNNVLEGLDLAGATLTPEQLRERLAERLRLPERPENGADRAVLRFASEDPIRFRLADGRAQLTLSLDEIRVGYRSHRRFKVHTFYRPAADGITAELVQDGTPQIEGRLRTAARIHLHGVMGKVLGENERIPLVRLSEDTPERFSAALVGLATNQFVIEDGWIGLAIGPPREEEDRVATQVGGYVR